jgi:stage V sporulation protein K
VAGYSGQTALKTKAVVDSALGGVLFVDEAYALIGEEGKDSFGREALDTLLKLLEDYRSDLVVIMAGYTNEMRKLLETNPGLKSRLPTELHFDDYSAEELLEIAEQMLLQDVMMLSMEAQQKLKQVLQEIVTPPGVKAKTGVNGAMIGGNGRAVRNILERAKRTQAVRLQQQGARKGSKEELCTLLPEDFDGCLS